MPNPKKRLTARGTTVRFAPDPPDIQDVLEEISELKDLVGNTLNSVIAIKELIAELQREVTDLSIRLDQ